MGNSSFWIDVATACGVACIATYILFWYQRKELARRDARLRELSERNMKERRNAEALPTYGGNRAGLTPAKTQPEKRKDGTSPEGTRSSSDDGSSTSMAIGLSDTPSKSPSNDSSSSGGVDGGGGGGE